MNLFRSEEHVRRWSGFKPDTEEGIIPLLDMAKGFSENLFARRMDADYVSHMEEYMMEGVEDFSEWGSFWQLPDE
jgi:Xaa-Pro aminopeptidase